MAVPRSTPGIGNSAWNRAGGAPQRFAPVKAGSRAPFGGYGQVPGVARVGMIGGGIAVSVQIDLQRLGAALGDVNLQRSPAIPRAINKGIDRLFTLMKRDITKWTGIPVSIVASGMRKQRAGAGHFQGAVVVRGKHYKIDGMFNAAWGGPSTPGGTHDAWNNPQMAQHSFMLGGVLKTRTTSARFPIKSLWGPNPAREVIRHQGHVQAQLNSIAATVVVPEIVRLVDLEFKRVKAKYGL